MADNIIIENDVKAQKELALINEVYDFVASVNSLPSEEEVINEILQLFSSNSQTILTASGSPYYTTLQAQAKFAQINAAMIKHSASKMLYTQSNGDDLSLASANYGVQRIEAKSSSMSINVTTDKDLTLNANTSFTDGGGSIWLSTQDIQIQKEVPTKVSLVSLIKGAISFISPLKLTSPIAGVTNIEVITTSVIIGRSQESDTELKETLGLGINVFGSDGLLRRSLLSLQMVNSAFVRTNPKIDNIVIEGDVTLKSRERYVCIRSSSETLSLEEADSIALTIIDNTIYNPLTPRPANNKVKQYFGMTEEELTKPTAEGGAGLDGVDASSNCIVYRIMAEYGNFIDIFFYLANPTDVDLILEISYKGNYEASEKENMVGNIKTLSAQAISELAQVGSELLTSSIVSRLYNTTDLTDKIEIRSINLSKHGLGSQSQYLLANSYEYFRIFSTSAEPYSGVIIREV